MSSFKVNLRPRITKHKGDSTFDFSIVVMSGEHVTQLLDRAGLAFHDSKTRREAYQYALATTRREAKKRGVDTVFTEWPNRKTAEDFGA